jgi:hypothetical protein
MVLVFTPYRRCILIVPILLASLIGGWLAYEGLWKATGGQYGDCTDICFEPHINGSASAAFGPLWALTVVVLAAAVIGSSFLLIRGSIRHAARRTSQGVNAPAA